jgi:DNA-binding MarR family transcriptional regulator
MASRPPPTKAARLTKGDTPVAELGEALQVMRLVWALDHSIRHLSRMMESHLGVTGPQRLVLRVVGKRPGVSAGALAEFMHLDSSTLSGHLNRLEQLGLIIRAAHVDDARRTSVTLTREGRNFDVKTPGTVEAAVEATLANTTGHDLAVVERFLGRLEQEIRTQAHATSSRATRTRARRARRR